MYDLERFIKAQEQTYQQAFSEMKSGHKRSHWIWYVFPQMKGLGFSFASEYYGIDGLDEAKAYMQNPILRKRLLEISEVLLDLPSSNARDVMGYPDDLKLRSSMTLFAEASPEYSIFQKVLDKFFGGDKDIKTLELLKQCRIILPNA